MSEQTSLMNVYKVSSTVRFLSSISGGVLTFLEAMSITLKMIWTSSTATLARSYITFWHSERVHRRASFCA